MPLREYQCDACGHRFEVIQKMSDAAIETCPTCGGIVHKLQSAPAFHLKGTGWYVTDYAKKDSSANKKEDAAKGSTEKGSTDKTGGKTDAAQATTPTTSSDSSSSTTPSPAPSSTKDSKPS